VKRDLIPRGRRLAAGLALAVLASAPPAGAVVVNRIVATVDGEPITSYQVDSFVRANVHGADPATLSPEDRKKIVNMLVNDTIVDLESSKLGVGASNDEVNAYIEQIKKQNNLDDEKLAAALKQQGLTLDQYRVQVKKEIQRSQLLARNVRSQVNVTPEEVQRYYDEHKAQFSQADAVTVRQIFFAVPHDPDPASLKALSDKAKRAYARLQSGESFESVARSMSEGPDAAQGGLLGTMKKGEMRPELEQVAFSLREGQYSQPVQSPYGIHILYVEKRDTGDAVPFDTVKEQIKEHLYAQATEQRFQQWVTDDLRKGHSVVIK
jgi:peptidyl-prolyl cis-trans isomerase SurA